MQPFSTVGIYLAIEDINKKIVEVSVYNKLPMTANLKEIDNIFKVGCRIGIKNPYLRLCVDGRLILRIDNP